MKWPGWRFLWSRLWVFDPVLLALLTLLTAVGMATLYSAVGGGDGRFADQSRNFGLALLVMWLVAQASPQVLQRVAPPVYLLGVVLLVAVELVGDTRQGAQRWLDLGVVSLQPSELMKIAMPMMLAWYFHRREGVLRWRDFLVAALLLAVPFLLIVKQPDLGTALLVFGAGFFVIFFAGLSFGLLVPIAALGTALVVGVLVFQDTLCAPDFDWQVLHDYQKNRVCTLLDPTADPLGRGFHTIQSSIAIGSGGLLGKGFMAGTQSQLDFVPERTTDFIFAVFAEEHGLVGGVVLLVLYLLVLVRGLMIAAAAPTTFTRLLAAAVTMVFFIYAFVNVGMVIGILPVVGVPLPFMSYGGTALITLGVAAGLLMTIHRHRIKRN